MLTKSLLYFKFIPFNLILLHACIVTQYINTFFILFLFKMTSQIYWHISEYIRRLRSRIYSLYIVLSFDSLRPETHANIREERKRKIWRGWKSDRAGISRVAHRPIVDARLKLLYHIVAHREEKLLRVLSILFSVLFQQNVSSLLFSFCFQKAKQLIQTTSLVPRHAVRENTLSPSFIPPVFEHKRASQRRSALVCARSKLISFSR